MTVAGTDRASIVLDAINHIHELRRTVGELKILVDKKRISKIKRHKTQEDTNTPPVGGDQHGTGVDAVAAVKPEPEEDFNCSTAIQLRSSWIQRKWKDSEVDVRIVDDDVTIKLVQRKKINCLLSVSRTLDELQLDLRHVAGGEVGDYYSYLFNTKVIRPRSLD
ncbi:transcription factor bHLH91-like [Chenopodium quinoa]|uniref:transcription factor bHLH91-like n=1 Tax=Chenopodium quinoa TaxID=63459 RepID=UPI000B773F7F|nr:transcription factor bHLH91-like [Chenopodium quinoa]